MEPVKGVDISEFNGSVDMQTLISGGVRFAIIRCGYGRDYKSQDDIRYAENVKKCEAAGMPYGVYLYSYAKNQSDALSEASHTLRLLQGTKPSYGVWYDVEDSTLPYGETLIENCAAYCKAIEDAGYYCGIYASLYFWQQRLNDSRLDAYDKWIAHWANEIGYDGEYGIWQYTDSGNIDGKLFDMNLAYKDYPAITGGDEIDMTKEEVIALIKTESQKIYDANEKKYPTIASTPEWVREDVLKVYEELKLTGSSGDFDGESTVINASNTYIRMMKVLSNLLDKIDAQDTASKTAEEK